MKKILLIGFIIFCIFQMMVMAAEILVGSAASDRGATLAQSETIVDANVAANASGTITTVEIWCNSNLAGCEVAIFSASGNDLTSHDSEVVDNGNGAGVVISGSKQTFTVDLDIEADQYIGMWWTSGDMERDYSGGAVGIWYLAGDQIPCTGATFGLSAERQISLHGIGSTSFALVKFNNVTCTKWNELAITKWNNKNIP